MPTYKEIITDAKDRMSKTREAFKREMQSMRAGRANPQILDRITVDYYGVQTPLNQMGNISAPEPRMLVISPPWKRPSRRATWASIPPTTAMWCA